MSSQRKRVTLPNGRRIAKYRLQVELALGRKLKSQEHVHHIDGDPTNNEWENLALMSRGMHFWLARIEKNVKNITLFDHKGRPFHPTGVQFVVCYDWQMGKEEDE